MRGGFQFAASRSFIDDNFVLTFEAAKGSCRSELAESARIVPVSLQVVSRVSKEGEKCVLQGTHKTKSFTSGVLLHVDMRQNTLNILFSFKNSRLQPW